MILPTKQGEAVMIHMEHSLLIIVLRSGYVERGAFGITPSAFYGSPAPGVGST